MGVVFTLYSSSQARRKYNLGSRDILDGVSNGVTPAHIVHGSSDRAVINSSDKELATPGVHYDIADSR